MQLMLCLQAQQSELQSLLRLTQSTGEEQGQEAHTASFRTLVLDRAIPQSLAVYILALFTTPLLEVAEDKTPADVVLSTQQSADAAPAAGRAQETSGVASVNASERIGKAADETPASTSASPDSAGTADTAGTAGSAGTAGPMAELCKQSSKQWGSAMEQAGLPWALQLLAAFARRHQVTMQCCAEQHSSPFTLVHVCCMHNFYLSV